MRPSSGTGRTNRGLVACKESAWSRGEAAIKRILRTSIPHGDSSTFKGLTFVSSSNIFHYYENHRAFEQTGQPDCREYR
jgi:hypothetical protein